MPFDFLSLSYPDRYRAILLSRLCEQGRFTIVRAGELDSNVSLETLRKYLETEKDVESDEVLAKLWEKLNDGLEAPLEVTFGELLDLESAVYPELSDEEVESLKQYGRECTDVVEKKDICLLLNVEPDSQVIQFIFATGLDQMPAEVFQDVVGSLSLHPEIPSFAEEYCSTMMGSGRRMMSFLPYVILLVAALAIVPFIIGVRQRSIVLTTRHFLEADWATGCPDGTSSVKGCKFIQKSLNDIQTVTKDARRYFHTELIAKLWPSSGRTAADTAFGYVDFPPVGQIGSTFPIGALVLRVSPIVSASVPITASCSQSNLSVPLVESRLGEDLDCSSIWFTAIPFNATQEEALAMASQMPIPTNGVGDVALIAQFASFDPVQELYLYTAISVTLPRGGSLLVRIEIQPFDYNSYWLLLPLLILSIFQFCFMILKMIFYTVKGCKTFTPDSLIELFLLVIISVVYGLFANIPSVGDIMQATYVPEGADTAARQYTVARYFLGFWTLFLVSSSIRFLREVGPLRLIVAIMEVVAIELLALVFVFAIWTIGFAYIAKLLFGGVSVKLYSPFSTFQFLFTYFLGDGDAEYLFQLHPVYGPLFWFAYSFFIFFFALNLIIAVLTAPLDLLQVQFSLQNEIIKKVVEDLASDPKTTRLMLYQFSIRISLIPVINLIHDSNPHPVRKMKWIDWHAALREIYSPNKATITSTLGACLTLANVLEDIRDMPPYETALVHELQHSSQIEPVATTFIVMLLTTLSPFDYVRDARLIKALRLYRQYTHQLDVIKETEAKLKSDCEALLASLLEASEEAAKGEDKKEKKEEGPKKNPLHVKGQNDTSDQRKEENEEAFPTTEEASEQNKNEIQKDEETDAKEGKHAKRENEDEQEISFNVTRYIDNALLDSSFQPLYFLTFLFLFVFVFATQLGTVLYSPFLVDGLNNALREFEILEECYDPGCTSAFTFKKTFMDTGDIADWYVWVEKVLKRQLFLRESLSTNPFDQGRVAWDNTTTFERPLFFRQLRASQTGCHFGPVPPAAPSNARYQHLKDTYKCFEATDLTKDPIPPPSDPAIAALIDPNAFTYSTFCPQSRDLSHRGLFSIYPCEGYTARVTNVTELDALMASGWFDNSTRLIVLVGVFKSDKARAEYDMIVELGIGGGAGAPETFAVSLEEDHSQLVTTFIIAVVFSCIDSIPSILYIVQYFVKRDAIFPGVPFRMLILYFLTLAFPYMIYPRSAGNERIKFQLCTVALYLVYQASVYLFFPLGGLVSKQSTKLFDTMAHSMVQIARLIPFFIVFILALAYTGLIMFAPHSYYFSRLDYALYVVTKGTLVWDNDELGNASPEVGTVYNLFFFGVVTVILANLVLAMVTSAAGEAVQTDDATLLAETSIQLRGHHILYDKWYNCIFAHNVYWLRRQAAESSEACRSVPALCLGEGRLVFPVEVMIWALGPLRANSVLGELHLDLIHDYVYRSSIPYILDLCRDFRDRFPAQEAEDRRLEQDVKTKKAMRQKKVADDVPTVVTDIAPDDDESKEQQQQHQ